MHSFYFLSLFLKKYPDEIILIFLGGGTADVLGEAAGQIHRGSQVRDNTLKALYGYEGYNTLKEGLADYKNNPTSMKPVVQVGFGSSHYQDTSSIHAVEAVGSQVAAGEEVVIRSKDDLTVKGSAVVGNDVTLEAGKNLSLNSSANTTVSQTDTSGKSSGAGISFSASGTGIYANVSANKGNEQEETVSHTESVVSAQNHLTMESGKDTVIHGGKTTGKKVTVQAGGNLSITSEKDSASYREKTSSKGGSIQMGGSYTAQAGKTNTNSRYESVTDQSGIYAGSEGYDVEVKGNTDLKGAVIDSKAPAEKNHLATGTLTWEDMGNNAKYEAGGYSIGYSKGGNTKLNEKGLTPYITPTVKDKAESTTKAGISEGTITITDKKNQKQDIANLKRDTKNSLGKLAQIFDKEDVKERQELIGILSKEGNKAIHKLAESKGWKEGSTEKVLAHGALGAILGGLSGGSALTGAMTGGVSEYVTGYLEKTKGKAWMEEHPDAVQNIAAVVGGALGALAGEAESGAYNGQSGVKWNYFAFADELSPVATIAKEILQKKNDENVTDEELRQVIAELNQVMVNQEPDKGNSGALYAEDISNYKAGIDALVQKGYTRDSAESFFKEYNRYLRKGIDWTYLNVMINVSGTGYHDTKTGISIVDNPGNISLPNVDSSTIGSPHSPEEYYPNGFRLGESIVMEGISEKADWIPEKLLEQSGYENWGTKAFFKAGGIIGVPLLVKDFYEDTQKYSGMDLYKAYLFDTYPVLGAIGGAVGGAMAGSGVPIIGSAAGSIAGSAGASILGEYEKDRQKGQLDTDNEKRAQQSYSNVNLKEGKE